MATEARCLHDNLLHSQCRVLHAYENTAFKLSHGSFRAKQRSSLHRRSMKAGELQNFMLLKVSASPSAPSSSSSSSSSSYTLSSPSASKLSKREGSFRFKEKWELNRSSENLRKTGEDGRFFLCRAEASPSSPSSLSTSSVPESPSPSSAPESSSMPAARRSPPVFVLNDKPDRSLHQTERPSQSPKPKRRQDVSFEDDQGSSLTVSHPNHKSGYVALIGKPNVGKSTLMNQIIGQKLSIVTNKPQTTRHRILGICSAQDYQMILYDTPGMIVKRMNKLDEMMMQNVRTAALNADCVLVIVDAAENPQKVIDTLEEGALKIVQSRPSLLVLNKRDVIKPGEIAKKLQWYEQFSGLNEVLAVSAKFGHGIDDLKEWLVSKLPLGPAYYPKGNVSDQPEKFFASEIVREKIFLQYMKEIPYVSQVNVLTYVERRPPAKDFIEIEIVVERDSQKAIMIGKEGAALKTLATAARLDIEDFVGRDVYLEIKVKVKEDWRANESLLKYYGYSGS